MMATKSPAPDLGSLNVQKLPPKPEHKFCLMERLCDFLIAKGLNTQGIFRNKGYQMQVDSLVTYLAHGKTLQTKQAGSQ